MNKTLKTITLGCRLNSYESNKISNFTNYSSEKDILVINTCAVTAEAERQARQEIRKARKEFPDSYIMATGCAVELNQKYWNNMPEVDKIIPNKNKLKPSLWGLKPEINNDKAINFESSIVLITSDFVSAFTSSIHSSYNISFIISAPLPLIHKLFFQNLVLSLQIFLLKYVSLLLLYFYIKYIVIIFGQRKIIYHRWQQQLQKE